jgi:nucleoside-diphosphate-sugar epimerase
MKAFITGGTGFIGSHLVELLVNQGHRMVCLTRKTSNLRWLSPLIAKKASAVETVNGDLNDPAAIAQRIGKVDFVFHLAGLTKAPNAETYHRVNAAGTKNLLEACLEANANLARFIYCSSLAAAGPSPNPTPITEAAVPGPLTDYGASKLKGEEIVREYADRLPITIIRPPAVYGPRDRDIFIFFQFINKGLMPIIGNENKLLSLVYVKDLVAGMYAAAVSERATGQTYFLTDGAIYKWLEIERAIAGALNKRPIKLKAPPFLLDAAAAVAEYAAKFSRRTPALNRQKARELKQLYWICDSAKAQRELGYQPTYPLEKGVAETARWYLENGWL